MTIEVHKRLRKYLGIIKEEKEMNIGDRWAQNRTNQDNHIQPYREQWGEKRTSLSENLKRLAGNNETAQCEA